jgi:hypothetical protein
MDGILTGPPAERRAGFRNQLISIPLFRVSAIFPKVSVNDRPTGGASSYERRAAYP